MPPHITASEAEALRRGAADVLAGNVKRGVDAATGIEYDYVCPSAAGGYPWQWFWDSCFHAIALSHVDPAAARRELRTLWAAQAPDGFIPHVIHWGAGILLPPAHLQCRLSWRPRHSALVQPPVLAQAALKVAERGGDDAFLAEALDRCKRYYLWLRDHRDPDADGLVSCITPYETGMDHLPAYDEALGAPNPSRLGLQVRLRLLDAANLVLGRNYRLSTIFERGRFNVEDVLFNCLYAEGLRCVARLCAMAGDQPSRDSFSRLADRAERAILDRCFHEDDGAFWSLRDPGGRPLRTLTVSSLAPLLLDSLPSERAEGIVRQLRDPRRFWPDYPVPSVAMTEPSFRPSERFLIWRGPTWINTNWMLVRGLRKHGYGDEAGELARRTIGLTLKSGFREFYNPHTGEGYGAERFGWSTLVLDLL